MTSASGTHRPADWTPLTGTDPVPGDPAAIRDEADHMKSVAPSLREQASELRIIGHGEGLKGKYADKLRASAMDLEKHLREVAERYEHVHGHLTSWAGELEDFQDESVRLLHNARSAEEHDTAAQHAAAHAAAHHPAGATAGTARGIHTGNTALGLGGQALGLSQASSFYNRLEDRYTVAFGSQW